MESRQESRQESIKKCWCLFKNIKTKHVVFDDVSYYYKTLCISKLDKRMDIFDTSTDIYRPLTNKEIRQLLELGLEKFTTKLSIENTLKSISLNRNMFHIAIAKGSDKEKEFFYRKTMRRIKKLRQLLGYQQKIT
ncbi:MAG: hypothetical protein Tp133SUR523431_6 [Prokaryotic dsDNA virus sp.]|nr:MAG: hypothetical protein Tp133SUR523431_6 [Prokaryotic dsDNA virus sp.]|tara:strand:+ start:675 stop:1079 length:405 start_codon:yes stop_codon:yes gene_type:complete